MSRSGPAARRLLSTAVIDPSPQLTHFMGLLSLGWPMAAVSARHLQISEPLRQDHLSPQRREHTGDAHGCGVLVNGGGHLMAAVAPRAWTLRLSVDRVRLDNSPNSLQIAFR
jgi:hypothetical protein